jgi:hypothetical protein
MEEEGSAAAKKSGVAEMPEFDAAEDSGSKKQARRCCGGGCGAERKTGPAATPVPTVPLTRVLRLLRGRNRVYMLFGW